MSGYAMEKQRLTRHFSCPGAHPQQTYTSRWSKVSPVLWKELVKNIGQGTRSQP